MNFESVRDFISKFTEILLKYEIEHETGPEYAYIPVEDFDRLAQMVKDEDDIRIPGGGMRMYFDMIRYRYLFIYGVKCHRSYVSELNFSTPSRPEYGMYLGKP